MSSSSINIAISGLGLSTTEDLKIRLRNLLPNDVGVNWINIADQNINGLLINEAFIDNQHIQNIIQHKKIPYLKISKQSTSSKSLEGHVLHIPIADELPLKKWVDVQLLPQSNIQSADQRRPEVSTIQKDYSFFTEITQNDSRKLHFKDQFGTLAIIDHYRHFAWLEPSRQQIQTDHSIEYSQASTTDFIKVSRKKQINLEDWFFNLIWNSNQLLALPEPHLHYKIHFWPQPFNAERKIILQLSACFSHGAEIADVATKLGIPLETVQYFIATNLAINNAEKITAKTSQFGHLLKSQAENSDHGALISFFGKLKRRFGF